MMKVRGIRGATTVEANSPEQIFDATAALVKEVVAQNDLVIDDVASVLLTMSPDLNADFPAKAIRSLDGWRWVPLMCATEIDVPGALSQCIRILVHVNTVKTAEDMNHVYLGKATALRPDLSR